MAYGPTPNYRRGNNYGEQAVSFRLADAERIGRVVMEVESERRPARGSKLSRAVTPSHHYLSKTTGAWSKGTKQTLTIYSGDGGSEAAQSGETVEAWNYVANLPSGLWVVLARGNATFYVASFDMTGLSGYSASAQQVLGHNTSGQLVWLNTTACT